MDFIRTHIISKIKEQIKEKQKVLKFEGFFYLDKPINDKTKTINRLNQHAIYPKEELLPMNWYQINGSALLDVFSQVKDNKVYIYKILEGKSHKMRIKNKK
jgi:hypothetical protein